MAHMINWAHALPNAKHAHQVNVYLDILLLYSLNYWLIFCGRRIDCCDACCLFESNHMQLWFQLTSPFVGEHNLWTFPWSHFLVSGPSAIKSQDSPSAWVICWSPRCIEYFDFVSCASDPAMVLLTLYAKKKHISYSNYYIKWAIRLLYVNNVNLDFSWTQTHALTRTTHSMK